MENEREKIMGGFQDFMRLIFCVGIFFVWSFCVGKEGVGERRGRANVSEGVYFLVWVCIGFIDV